MIFQNVFSNLELLDGFGKLVASVLVSCHSNTQSFELTTVELLRESAIKLMQLNENVTRSTIRQFKEFGKFDLLSKGRSTVIISNKSCVKCFDLCVVFAILPHL